LIAVATGPSLSALPATQFCLEWPAEPRGRIGFVRGPVFPYPSGFRSSCLFSRQLGLHGARRVVI